MLCNLGSVSRSILRLFKISEHFVFNFNAESSILQGTERVLRDCWL